MNSKRKRDEASSALEGRLAALQPTHASAKAHRENSPDVAMRASGAQKLFEPAVKSFDGAAAPVSDVHLPRRRWSVSGVVLLALTGSLLVAVQEMNAPGQTNALPPAEAFDQADALDQTDAADQTGGLAQTGAAGQASVRNRATRERGSLRQRPDRASSPDRIGGSVQANSAASPNGAGARLDFSAFNIIATRNIFDPNRRGFRARAQQKVTEYFALVGTMSYEKGTFAFFDGPTAQYKKVLELADAIADYKVTNITANSVKLASATNELELRVGMQMRRDDAGQWFLAAQSEPSSSPAASAEAAAAPAGPDSDIIKRLMEKREKELNR